VIWCELQEFATSMSPVPIKSSRN